LISAGLAADWPDARGVWKDEWNAAWVNYDDHLSVAVTKGGADLEGAFGGLVGILHSVETDLATDGITFMKSDRLGYLTTDPTFVGSGVRATATVLLPCMSSQPKELKALSEERQVTITRAVEENTWRVTCTESMQYSAVEIVNRLGAAVTELVKLENVRKRETVLLKKQKTREEESGQAAGEEHKVPADSDPKPAVAASPATQAAEPKPQAPPVPNIDFSAPESLPDLASHKSAVGKVLAKNSGLYSSLRELKTGLNSSLMQCIREGVEDATLTGSGVTVVDEQCYDVYGALVNQVVEQCTGFPIGSTHPVDLNVAKLPEGTLGLEDSDVRFVQIETRRNFSGVRFVGAATADERREVERVVARALLGAVEGDYYPQAGSTSYAPKPTGMSAAEVDKLKTLTASMFGDLVMPAHSAKAISAEQWPDARGVYAAASGNVVVWVNHEDHLRAFVRRTGADISAAFKELVSVVGQVGVGAAEASPEIKGFAQHSRLGFLTTDPARCGTALKFTVAMSCPSFIQDQALVDNLASSYGTTVELTGDGLVFTYEALPGRSEIDAAKHVTRAAAHVRGAERRLARGAPIFEKQDGLGPEPLQGAISSKESPALLPDLSKHHSDVAKILREKPEVYVQLKDVKTASGSTLARCIKPGIDVKGDARMPQPGIVAVDESCFTVFAQLFDPIVERRLQHSLSAQHATDLAAAKVRSDVLDKSGCYIKQISFRTGRNLRGLPLAGALDVLQRRELERVLVRSLLHLSGEQVGDYFPLRDSTSYVPKPNGMSEEEEKRLEGQECLFHEPDSKVALSAGVGRHWPDARGVFYSSCKDWYAWINQEDHIKLTVVEKSSNFKKGFTRLVGLLEHLEQFVKEQDFEFMHSDRFGYLTSDITNLGTGLRVSVSLHLDYVDSDQVAEVCKGFDLVCTGYGFETSVSNKKVLGKSEVQIVNDLVGALEEILKMEEAAAAAGVPPGA